MFNKNYLIILIFGFIAVAFTISAFFAFYNYKSVMPVACSQEAKLCPDGSYVGRQGPNCEFTECSNEVEMGVVSGKVSIGPICPVEQAGVPCPVPTEAYTSREVILYSIDGVTIVKRMNFLSNGTYSFEVKPGTYILNIPRQGIDSSSEFYGEKRRKITIFYGKRMHTLS